MALGRLLTLKAQVFQGSGGTIFAWGGGGGARLDPMVWIWVLAHRFRDEDQKKGLRRKILGFVVMFTRVFVLEQNFTHA